MDCLTVPADDPEAVRDAIERLLGNDDLRHDIGRAARSRGGSSHLSGNVGQNRGGGHGSPILGAPRTPLELDETRPLIAVVVPTFERSDLVVRAVQSILAQRFTGFEVVVVDDGSTEDIGGGARGGL